MGARSAWGRCLSTLLLWLAACAVAWAADAPDGGTYVALFNRDASRARVEVPFANLGLSGVHSVRDLWARAPRGEAASSVSAELAPHGSALLKLSPAK